MHWTFRMNRLGPRDSVGGRGCTFSLLLLSSFLWVLRFPDDSQLPLHPYPNKRTLQIGSYRSVLAGMVSQGRVMLSKYSNHVGETGVEEKAS